MVHGIRTSATMWRSQVEYLTARGNPAVAVDLPGHGSRMAEEFTLEGAFSTIDDAVRDAATRGPVLLVGHSMGGLLCVEYVGGEDPPPVAGFIAASCTSIPRGLGSHGLSRAWPAASTRSPTAGCGSRTACSIASCPTRPAPTSAPAGTRWTHRTSPCAACQSSICSRRCTASTCRCGSSTDSSISCASMNGSSCRWRSTPS